MEAQILLLLAATLFGYGLLARKIDQADITAPMVFTLAGIVSGPLMLGWVDTQLSNPGIMLVAELTLAIVLFSDASRIRRRHLIQFERFPIRLLAIGLPLTILCGAVIAHWLLGVSWLFAFILATILTPTDAALAQSVMDKKEIDRNLRRSINVESGLNDGIALPLLLMLLALMTLAGGEQLDGFYWAEFISLQLILGTLSGIVIGRLGSYLINHAHNSRWISPMYQRLSSISLAIIAFSLAEILHGNGFIAVFLAGLFMQSRHKVVIARIKEFGEAEGQLLTLAVFFIFGAVFIPGAWRAITIESVIYALLSLTLIRMLPVWISLTGTKLELKSKTFLAWFGPRGIASILYLLLLLEHTTLADAELKKDAALQLLYSTATLTIFISIFLHGASTSFWNRLFRKN
ncbi:cation:proton antiporter [Bacterioplanoides sp.]|uniref:cation:proton antiporter n=1 Tax=Bacterioplanoides sp. TaxID=2066072 RepID=UPI003B5BDF0A